MENKYIFEKSLLSAWPNYLFENKIEPDIEYDFFQMKMKIAHPEYPDVIYPPLIFDREFVCNLQNVAVQLLSLITSIPDRIFSGNHEAWMSFLKFDKNEIEYLLPMCTPRFLSMATQFSRPDFILTKYGFKVVEINVAPPIGGLGIYDRMAQEIYKMPFYNYLIKHREFCTAPNMTTVWLKAIKAISRVSNAYENPIFFEGMANPNENYAADFGRPDFVRMIESCGYKVVTGPMSELTVSDAGVYFEDMKVNTVFTCSTYYEMTSHGVADSLITSLTKADEEFLIDFVCPPTNTLFDHKLNLEILTSPEFESYFSAEELSIVKRYVLSTRRLNTDNLSKALSEKDSWILKPASEFGGNGVIIGEAVSGVTWRDKLNAALSSESTYVLQEKAKDMWSYETTHHGITRNFSVCLGPTIFGHEYGGLYLRQSEFNGVARVINAAQGAAVGTAFVAEKSTDAPISGI
ncbi:hypothetical protein ACL2XQ_09860 [Sodalis sp. RH14]|uniref:hypothetical protein n=1 Tax=Sodalis sp. RH14 TaxID=3394329 RepID=UPI0039B56BDB